MIQLTAESLALFIALAEDAPNWNNEPLVDISSAQRGNLADLKKKGLVTTFNDDGCLFAQFTESGAEMAEFLGFTVR